MNDLRSMIWVEVRKAIRSRMPIWTALGSMLLPLGIAFLIFVARNPQISERLGLFSAKADIVAYAATDWQAYMQLIGETIGAGGIMLFIFILSWIFGREFTDGTLKDMLSVPVSRGSIILAKYVVMMFWGEALAIFLLVAALILGWIINLPGSSTALFFEGASNVIAASFLAIIVALPFALLASIGRGFLLPIGIAVLMMILTNFTQILGWGEFFPWAIPVIYSLDTPLTAISYWIVFLTGVLGIVGTILWWKFADHNH
jgi:ABC-2 type transport system permease protein